MVIDADVLRKAARVLLDCPAFHEVLAVLPDDRIEQTFNMVERGDLVPDIRYRIQPLAELVAGGSRFVTIECDSLLSGR